MDDVIWLSDQRAVAVGGAYDRVTALSRGVVLISDDGGRRWRRTGDLELPRLRFLSRRDGDRALVAFGDWSPTTLSRAFESRDGGENWQSIDTPDSPAGRPAETSSSQLKAWAQATRAHTVVRDACRAGESVIWAVGDHSVILRSDDAGKSWEVSRGSGRQSAILIVARDHASVPWSLLGSESIEMRNRVSLLLTGIEPSAHPTSPSKLDLLRQATTQLGGASADAVRESDPSAVSGEAENWLAIHRPAVLVLDQSLPEATRSAFRDAAIASGVLRIVGYSFGGRGETILHGNALLPSSGVLARDLWEDALNHVAGDKIAPNALSLHRSYDAVGTKLRGESVASGLALNPGQKIAPRRDPVSRRRLQVLQARLSEPTRIANLIQSSRSSNEFATSLKALLDRTATEDQFRLAWSVLKQTIPDAPRQDTATRHASRLESSGFQEAALQEISQRFPTTSAAAWTTLRRQSIQNSREWNRLRASMIGSLAANQAQVAAAAEIVPVSPFQINSSRVVQASATSPLRVPDMTPIDITPTREPSSRVDLTWEFHPLVVVAREAARHRGDQQKLQAAGNSGNVQRLIDAADSDDWSSLLRANGDRVLIAAHADSPPRLDGSTGDPCWQSGTASSSRASSVGGMRVRMAFDDQYVYVAVRCASFTLRPDTDAPDSARIRDHDLSNIDRIGLSIDTDLDLLTSLQLEMTDSGRTRDSIDGHDEWQPTWYVASQRVGENVTFEIAIQRRDLTDLPIHEGQSWFISARTLAAGEVSGWTPMPTPSDWHRVVFRQ